MKEKRQVERRPTTQLERDAVEALKRCSMPPATSKKRFVTGLPSPTLRLSEKEANYVLLLCYHFRRQIPQALISRVWAEWFEHPERIAGYRISGELAQFRAYQESRVINGGTT